MNLLGVLGVTGVLVAWDPDIQNYVQNHRFPVTDAMANIFELFGYGIYVVPVLLLLYGWGARVHSPRLCRLALLGLECYLLAGAFAWMFKLAAGRRRPFVRWPGAWRGPSAPRNNSFPSGHATTVFSLATMIASTYTHWAVGPVAYGMGVLTAWARVNDNKHWASDVFFGCVLGYYIAKVVDRNHPVGFGESPEPSPRAEEKEQESRA